LLGKPVSAWHVGYPLVVADLDNPAPVDEVSSSAVVERLTDLVVSWDPIALVIDQRSAAASLGSYLADAGVEAEMTNSSQFALACSGFLDDALAGRLSHCAQRILDDAVLSATKRAMPGDRFARARAKDGSIAPLVSATLAHWSLLVYGGTVKRMPAPPVLGSESLRSREDDEFDRVLGPGIDIMTTSF
jgi:hypothetical protein